LSKTALEGERKQVSALFADPKSSMELRADRDMPSAILITQAVLGLAQGYMDVKPLGPVRVKGLPGRRWHRPDEAIAPP